MRNFAEACERLKNHRQDICNGAEEYLQSLNNAKNEPLDAKLGVYPAENEARKASKKYVLRRTPLVIVLVVFSKEDV